MWDAEEFAARGLESSIAQCSLSYNEKKGTLRGMHYQVAPHEEVKIVRCIRGAIFDVVLDLREGSKSHGRWEAAELSAENRRSLYIPRGVAHGFQTLMADTEVFYAINTRHVFEAARGVRWDDPKFAIQWPETDHRTMSLRDQTFEFS